MSAGAGARAVRFDAPTRLQGVDLARGLAVMGMFAAHLLAIDPFEWSDPDTWIDVANGRSSILFAVLAGVSLALVSGGRSPVVGERMRTVRLRVAVRALALWVIGIAMIVTGVPVYVILPAYAILFLLALPLLSTRRAVLWSMVGAGALLLPWLQPGLDELPVWQGAVGADLSLLLGWHYPFTLWIVFIVAGLAIGRADLRRLGTQLTLTFGGVSAAAAAYGAAAAGRAATEGGAGWVDTSASSGDALWTRVWTAEAHSGGILEVIGSGGFAVAVLGVCLLVCRTPLTWLALPIRAVGAMPLTAYVGQLVAWAIIAQWQLGDTGDLGGFRALDPLVPFILTTLVLCTAWALLVGQGPLERLLAWTSRRLIADPGTARVER